MANRPLWQEMIYRMVKCRYLKMNYFLLDSNNNVLIYTQLVSCHCTTSTTFDIFTALYLYNCGLTNYCCIKGTFDLIDLLEFVSASLCNLRRVRYHYAAVLVGRVTVFARPFVRHVKGS